MTIKKIPIILFILGVILIGFYGLALSVFAVLIQISMLSNYWKNNPNSKQPKKFAVGVILYLSGLILFVVGLAQRNNYFGGIGLIVWIVIGALPFLAGSLILLSLPTSPKSPKLNT